MLAAKVSMYSRIKLDKWWVRACIGLMFGIFLSAGSFHFGPATLERVGGWWVQPYHKPFIADRFTTNGPLGPITQDIPQNCTFQLVLPVAIALALVGRRDTLLVGAGVILPSFLGIFVIFLGRNSCISLNDWNNFNHERDTPFISFWAAEHFTLFVAFFLGLYLYKGSNEALSRLDHRRIDASLLVKLRKQKLRLGVWIVSVFHVIEPLFLSNNLEIYGPWMGIGRVLANPAWLVSWFLPAMIFGILFKVHFLRRLGAGVVLGALISLPVTWRDFTDDVFYNFSNPLRLIHDFTDVFMNLVSKIEFSNLIQTVMLFSFCVIIITKFVFWVILLFDSFCLARSMRKAVSN
jgi:hypothetical protein